MTESQAKQKWINWLKGQVGYHEQGENITKYAEEDIDTKLYGFDMQGMPWCDYFGDVSYIKVFGFELGARMTYQYPTGSAACETSAGYYKENNAWYPYPMVGDQVFFIYSGGINHVEQVIEVDGATIVTIGGNSSDSVRQNTWSISDGKIAGYGRPNWSLVCTTDKDEEVAEEIVQEATDSIQKGDVVKIQNGGTWYTGTAIPDWVFTKNWYVYQVYGNRAVLDESTDGYKGLMSPIDVKYLTKISQGENSEKQNDIQTPEVNGTYTVQKGDSLWKIAQETLGSGARYPEIKELNGLESDIIYPGQVLQLP